MVQHNGTAGLARVTRLGDGCNQLGKQSLELHIGATSDATWQTLKEQLEQLHALSQAERLSINQCLFNFRWLFILALRLRSQI